MTNLHSNDDANPSSSHLFGQRAAALVTAARDTIASELGCDADEVIFTASATEANNLALRGIALAHREQGRHTVTSAIEHKAVLACCMSTPPKAPANSPSTYNKPRSTCCPCPRTNSTARKASAAWSSATASTRGCNHPWPAADKNMACAQAPWPRIRSLA